MPAAIAIPLATAAGTATAGVIGSHMQASAADEASKREQKLSEQALADARSARAWQQAQYANYLERLRPYSQYGVNSANTLNNLLRLSPYSQMANRGMPAAPTVPRPIPPMPVQPVNMRNGSYVAPGSLNVMADARREE